MVNTNSELLVDKEGGIRRTGGDIELYNELMDLFFEQSVQQIKQLDDAIQKKQAQSIRELAHSIKGAAGNLGVNLVHQTATVLEQIGAESILEHADDAYSKLKLEIDRVKDYWKKSG